MKIKKIKDLGIVIPAYNEFKTIASDILKNDRDKLKVDNSDLLTPLQTQLKSFRERIETITKQQVEERTTLKEQIKSLHEANIETQQSAKNLTEALTYDNKIQGDWGEEILSSLLSSYGFQEGVEFDLQKQYKNEMGEKFKPDVILHLPEGKDVVIDSKVSLKDYVDYVADQTNELALKKHITSIENQIKNILVNIRFSFPRRVCLFSSHHLFLLKLFYRLEINGHKRECPDKISSGWRAKNIIRPI